MQRYENIDKKLNKELQKIDQKLENDSAEMSAQDIELADCIFHALASSEKYYMMSEGGMSGNYGGSYEGSGNSYARGRDSRGRYTSREMSREGGYPGGY